MPFPPGTSDAATPAAVRPAYNLCSLVSDPVLYARMVDSFQAAGFTTSDCE